MHICVKCKVDKKGGPTFTQLPRWTNILYSVGYYSPNNSVTSHHIAENLNLQRHVCGTLGLTNKICQQNLQPDVFEYEVTNRAIIKQAWVSLLCLKSNWKSV